MKTLILNVTAIIRNTFSLLVPLLATGIILAGQARGQVSTFALDTLVATPNTVVTFPLKVSNLNDVGAITIYITYAPASLTFQGADNWHPAFDNGYNLANGTNTTVGVVWFDTAGVSIASGNIVNLHFLYKGGSTELNFTTSCEVTDDQGNLISPPPVYRKGRILPMISVNLQASSSSICPGNSLDLTASTSGGYGNYTYTWASQPSGLSASTAIVNVSPVAPTRYFVTVSDGVYQDTASVLIGVFADQPVQSVISMIPVDSTNGTGINPTLSWLPGMHSLSYDLYVWREGQAVPGTPTVSNLTQLSYPLINLNYDTRYYWKVVSKNNCYAASSAVNTFTTLALPELHIIALDHSLSKDGQAIQVTWTVRNDGNGPTTTPTWYERVWISPDIDLRVGEPEDILLGTYTNPIGLAPGQTYTQVKTIPLPQNYIGTYFLFVVTDALDAIISFDPNAVFPNPYNPPPYLFAFSHGGAGVDLVREPSDNSPWFDNFFYKEISFPVPPLPDLVVPSVAAPISTFSGQTVTVNWTVLNDGEAAAPLVTWYDKVYFSSDSTLDPQDVYLGQLSHLGILNPDSSYPAALNVTIPNFIQGNYYIIVHTDQTDKVFEHAFNENNISVSAAINITLTPPPDLYVTSVTVDTSLSNGQQALVKWSVLNQGLTAPIATTWVDAVYISPSPLFEDPAKVKLGELSHSSSSFGPGSFYFGQLLVNIPKNINGPHYFFVHTDFKNHVFEYLLDSNNITRTAGSSNIYSPDLQPTDLITPDTNDDGGTFTGDWLIHNLGPGDLINQNWTERVYLSTTPIFQQSYADVIGAITLPSLPIPAGSFIPVSANLNLPPSLAEGTYFIHVASDNNYQIFENGNESNNVLAVPKPITIMRPDLVTTSIQTPDTAWSGLPINISWYCANRGTAPSQNTWRDRIYLSAAAAYHPSTVTFLGDADYTGTVMPGDSVLRTASVVLPNGVSGSFFIAIHTDYLGSVAEGGRDDNNIGVSHPSMLVRLSPYADLKPDTVFHPDTVFAGTYVDLGFRVRNIGGLPASGSSWLDRILIGTNSNPSLGTTYALGTFNRVLPLDVDSSYEHLAGFQIPSNLSAGQYYIIGKTDENNTIFEHIGEANNFLGSRLYVKAYPIDLAAISAMSVSDTLDSGAPINLSWTVENEGIVKTLANNWEDGAYLSADTIWDPADIYLGKQTISGPIQPGSTYSRSMQVNAPWGISGDYYLIIKADRSNANKDVDLSNNAKPCKEQSGVYVKLHINQLPTPDLVISSLEVPSQAFSGQPFKLKWTVTNQGPGTALIQRLDQFYLSNDFTLGTGDPMLLNRANNVILTTGASYSDSAMVVTNVGANANFVVIAKTDGTNQIFEYQGENNNTAMSFMAVSVPPPSDLIVSEVIVPDTILVGHNAPIGYTVSNIGPNPANGIIADGFYLSQDNTLDNSDILMHVWDGSIGLSPSSSIQRNQSPIVPGIAEGFYYLIVATDVKLTINEQVDTNNTRSSLVYVSLRTMPMEVWVDTTLDHLEYLYWRIEIPDSLIGETVLVELKGDSLTGNNELFYAMDRMPSKIDWDRRQTFFFKGNQELVIPEVHSGKHYLMATGLSTSYNSQQIRLRARKVNFEVRHYDPHEGGNTGTVTMQIDGSKFTPDMEVWLVNDTMPTSIIKALPVDFIDATKVFATLVLNQDNYQGDYGRTPLTPGIYDLYFVKPDVDTLIIEEGFEVLPGTDPILYLNIQHPPSVRVNRYFTMSIQYANGGNVDVIAPKAILVSKGGSPIALSMDELALLKYDLELNFNDPEGPPGILRPGALYTHTIYSKSTSRLLFKLMRAD